MPPMSIFSMISSSSAFDLPFLQKDKINNHQVNFGNFILASCCSSLAKFRRANMPPNTLGCKCFNTTAQG